MFPASRSPLRRPVAAPRARGSGLRAARGLLCAPGLAAVGCFSPVQLPAPADPTREVPSVGENLGPAAPGRQWVVLDTPNDTAQVSAVLGTVHTSDGDGNAITGEATRDLCVTPCVTDLHIDVKRSLCAPM